MPGLLPGLLPSAAGCCRVCCRVLPGAAGCCQAETMWGHFQVLPGAAGLPGCRVAGLPGCRVAGLPVGCRKVAGSGCRGSCRGCVPGVRWVIVSSSDEMLWVWMSQWC